MKNLSKICDSADWFDNEFYNVIVNELKEQPRFHRKQWEFAIIFLALQKLGFLDENKTGLSMGGGNERVLYSIANHVKKLIVTDLYDSDTTWDCARTYDPTEFIMQSKPFYVDESKIQAIRMDMRSLDFEDNSFDFCYSSCAFEHIGSYDDFVQHLSEVHRCLKEDGIYVFTTELQLGNTTIEDPNNYIFSPEMLQKILNETDLSLEVNPDTTLTDITSNYPLPSNVSKLCWMNDNNIAGELLYHYPHVVLLRGRYPFTSIQFILRKKGTNSERNVLNFNKMNETKIFAEKGLKNYRDTIENSDVNISPFSSLPNGVSPYFLDHSDFFTDDANPEDNTVFHSDYYWLGSGKRSFQVEMKPVDIDPGNENIIQLRIHCYPTLNSENVSCVYEKDINVFAENHITETITIDIDENYCYSILAKQSAGNSKFNSISINSRKIGIIETQNIPTQLTI